MERQRNIVRVSIIGIAVNLLLVAFKAVVGLVTGSIAIIMDAVNNLSDALSSVITIVGTKLAGKAPNKKHPYGYGRIEYVTSITIAVIVLLAGVSSFTESFKRILNPETAHYSAVSLLIIAVAVVVKFLLGRYVKNQGHKNNSDSLIASGQDAVFDSAISLSTLAAAAISILFHINVEGWLGVAISVVIVKAGVEILMDSLSSIIGNRVDGELIDNMKTLISSYPDVDGVYDLVLHQYGPQEYIGSVHVEVDDNLTAKEIHKMTRLITKDVYKHFGIFLTIGIYASNTDTNEFAQMKADLRELLSTREEVLQMHGFYVDSDAKVVTFDLILDFNTPDPAAVRDEIANKMREMYPDYRFYIILDKVF